MDWDCKEPKSLSIRPARRCFDIQSPFQHEDDDEHSQIGVAAIKGDEKTTKGSDEENENDELVSRSPAF